MDYILEGEVNFAPDEAFRRYDRLKRLFDLVVAFGIAVCAAIPCVIISLCIRATSHGPVIFRQERIGRYGKPFTCYKFRTMKEGTPTEATSEFKNAESYITKVGAILRKTSLDELPQIMNIIKGDMSFIGPRPLIPKEKKIHEKRYAAGVYFVRPGISGLAQVNGRDTVTADEKVRYDTEYLKNYGLKSDISIILKTVSAVVSEKGVVEGAQGNNEKK